VKTIDENKKTHDLDNYTAAGFSGTAVVIVTTAVGPANQIYRNISNDIAK